MIKFPIIIEWKWIFKLINKINGFKYSGLEYFFPFIIVKNKKDFVVVRHETIHFKQMCETLVIGWYFLYIYYYLRNRIKGMNHEKAFDNIPFELEAENFDKNIDYLRNRKKYCWFWY
jgi:hypothetical protein